MNRNHGFSLLEVIAVMVLLGFLAGMVAPAIVNVLETRKPDLTRLEMSALATALDLFYASTGRYPTTEEGLEALRRDPGTGDWRGPYLNKELKPDAWKNPYQYSSPGNHGDYDLWSLGRDGRPGGQGLDADITSWE